MEVLTGVIVIVVAIFAAAISLGALMGTWNKSTKETLESSITTLTNYMTRQFADLQANSNRIEHTLTARINEVATGHTERMNRVETGLTDRINQVETGLTEKIDRLENQFKADHRRLETDIRADIKTLEKEFRADIKALDARVFYLGTNQKQPPLAVDDLHAAQFPVRHKVAEVALR